MRFEFLRSPVLRPVFRDFSLLFLGASLYTLAAPPYEWSFAGWFALTPLYLVAARKSPWGAFLAGLVYGVLFCLGMAYWVSIAVASFFPLGAPLGFLCTLLSYLFFIASYVGLATAGAAILVRSASPLWPWLGLPALWVSAEFARTSLFSGFSWELLGYTQYRHLWLIQIADLTGVYGLSFLMAFSGYFVATLIQWFLALRFSSHPLRLTPHVSRLSSLVSRPQCPIPLPWRAGACFFLALIVTVSYGDFRVRHHEQTSTTPLTIALVHANTSGAQRWQRVHYAHVLLQYTSISQRGLAGAKPDLVVWPEFALGFYPEREFTLRAQLARFTSRLNAPLLVGAPRMEETTENVYYYNTAYLLAPNGAILGTYDKLRLLPFAEYRPLGLPSILPHSAAYPTEFTSGSRSTVFPLGQASFGVTICYEVTYSTLTRQLARQGAQFLVNLSNESWLAQAGAAAPAQHFSMAVFRAVETRRPLARVAAFGLSGFIDVVGRIQTLSALDEGVLLGKVVPHTEQTVYTRHGDWFAISCVGLAGLALLNAWRRS